MGNKDIYKIIFRNQDKIYEIHAHTVQESNLFGFIEISQLIFGEKSELLIDPAEEKLQSEFSDVNLSLIPLHAIIRIDKVVRQGRNKIVNSDTGSNISHFPSTPVKPQNQ